jgi:outer membrane protein
VTRATLPIVAAVLALAARSAFAQPPGSTPPAQKPPAPPAGAPPAPAPARVLTLEDALKIGLARQPQLVQARATTDAARARVDQALAPLLPQITGNAFYERYTTSTGAAGGAAAIGLGRTTGAQDLYSVGISGRQLIYDFSQTSDRWRASKAVAAGQLESEHSTAQTVALGIRSTYFNAVAAKALVGVARETLDNERQHLDQIKGFVDVGTRPAIDLVTERATYANAQVRLIQSENTYATSRVQVEQAIGVTDLGPWEVAEEALPPVQGEDAAPQVLLDEAIKARPDILSLERQLDAQKLTVSSLQGGYGPSLGLSGGYSETGPRTSDLVANWNAQVTLTWNLFQGGLTRGQVREANANVTALSAQIEQLRQQVRLDVEQARLGVMAGIASLGAAKDASQAARERLGLAEGRYRTGVGSVIELSDAQLALTSALGQQVQSEFQLAVARSQLLRALGRM